MKEIQKSLAIFCIATYGEGDPTDNAMDFYEWLQNGDADLEGLNYAVSALLGLFQIQIIIVCVNNNLLLEFTCCVTGFIVIIHIYFLNILITVHFNLLEYTSDLILDNCII